MCVTLISSSLLPDTLVSGHECEPILVEFRMIRCVCLRLIALAEPIVCASMRLSKLSSVGKGW